MILTFGKLFFPLYFGWQIQLSYQSFLAYITIKVFSFFQSEGNIQSCDAGLQNTKLKPQNQMVKLEPYCPAIIQLSGCKHVGLWNQRALFLTLCMTPYIIFESMLLIMNMFFLSFISYNSFKYKSASSFLRSCVSFLFVQYCRATPFLIQNGLLVNT